MKRLLLAAFLLLIPLSSQAKLKCTGDAFSHACTTCGYCAHCAKQGGTCGVCKAKPTPKPKPKPKPDH